MFELSPNLDNGLKLNIAFKIVFEGRAKFETVELEFTFTLSTVAVIVSFGSISFTVNVSFALKVSFDSVNVAVALSPLTTVIVGASFVPFIVIVTVLLSLALPSLTVIV